MPKFPGHSVEARPTEPFRHDRRCTCHTAPTCGSKKRPNRQQDCKRGSYFLRSLVAGQHLHDSQVLLLSADNNAAALQHEISAPHLQAALTWPTFLNWKRLLKNHRLMQGHDGGHAHCSCTVSPFASIVQPAQRRTDASQSMVDKETDMISSRGHMARTSNRPCWTKKQT